MKTRKRTLRATLPVWVLATLLASLTVGCAAHRDLDRFSSPYPRPTANLILSARSDVTVDPQLFAYRSTWPSTEGDTSLGQTVHYRILWYDRQSLWPNRHDYSYRTFRSYREGTQIR